MEPLHEQEIDNAIQRLKDSGRNPDDYTFDLEFLPPEPDGGGMFTARYEVTIANVSTSHTASYIGGIGLDWVAAFEAAFQDGQFG